VIWAAILLLVGSQLGLFARMLIALRDLRKDYDDLRTDYNSLVHKSDCLKEEVMQLNKQTCSLAYDVKQLSPVEIIEALRRKERFLDQANTRIDNGIATARNLAETVGNNAARNLIRDCLERAARGEGPPISLLPNSGQRRCGRVRRPADHRPQEERDPHR